MTHTADACHTQRPFTHAETAADMAVVNMAAAPAGHTAARRHAEWFRLTQ